MRIGVACLHSGSSTIDGILVSVMKVFHSLRIVWSLVGYCFQERQNDRRYIIVALLSLLTVVSRSNRFLFRLGCINEDNSGK